MLEEHKYYRASNLRSQIVRDKRADFSSGVSEGSSPKGQGFTIYRKHRPATATSPWLDPELTAPNKSCHSKSRHECRSYDFLARLRVR